jgi:multicomponent Na+:H+ antiporter subunit E
VRRDIPYGLGLLAIWVALWQDISVANIASGAVVSVIIVRFVRLERARHPWPFRPLPALRFALYFCWKLIEASAVVAWEVVTPRNKINEGIVAVPIRGWSDGFITLVANAISLTPGTLTIEARRDPAVLYVHVLHLRDVEALRTDVRRLEELAMQAFGPEEALAS